MLRAVFRQNLELIRFRSPCGLLPAVFLRYDSDKTIWNRFVIESMRPIEAAWEYAH